MPYLSLCTSVETPRAAQEKLLLTLAENVSEILGKPPGVMMTSFVSGTMTMAGEAGPTAFVDLRSIGKPSTEQALALTKGLCETLGEALGIHPKRVYVNITDVPGANWGCNNKTFG
ncbi:MAG: tautomerase family protein [Alphaproteobacteria bacterium]|nr:MAG: tautomerase family protein [Alphaproteobacteria bacterium]